MVGIDPKYIIDSGKECIEHCPFEKIRPKIELTGDAVLKLRSLQDKFEDWEFLVYGNATKVEGFNYILEDITIPDQLGDIAAVDDIVVTGNYNTVIHKHPGNSVGFSHGDQETVNSNHEFSIVIGNDKKLTYLNGHACVKIDCGRYIKAPLDVEISIPKSKDSDFIKETEKIKIAAIADKNILPRFLGGKTQHVCKRCKKPLEDTEKEKEKRCGNCGIIYVFKN